MVVGALGSVLQPGQRQNRLEGAAQPHQLLLLSVQGPDLSAHGNECDNMCFKAVMTQH